MIVPQTLKQFITLNNYYITANLKRFTTLNNYYTATNLNDSENQTCHMNYCRNEEASFLYGKKLNSLDKHPTKKGIKPIISEKKKTPYSRIQPDRKEAIN